MAKDVLERITTPKGDALFPFLCTPDTRFNEDGVYQVGLIVDEEAAQPLCKKLDAMLKDSKQKALKGLKPAKKKSFDVNPVYAPEYDEDENETGNIIFKFSSYATYKDKRTGEIKEISPTLFDAKGKVIKKKINVGNGSVIRVNFSPKAYYMASTNRAGVKLYLNAVQIIELVEYGASAEAMGFGEEDGFDVDDIDDSGFDADDVGDADDGSGDF